MLTHGHKHFRCLLKCKIGIEIIETCFFLFLEIKNPPAMGPTGKVHGIYCFEI